MFLKNLLDFSSREIRDISKRERTFPPKFHSVFCCLPTALIEPLTPPFNLSVLPPTFDFLRSRKERRKLERSKSNLYNGKREAKYSMLSIYKH